MVSLVVGVGREGRRRGGEVVEMTGASVVMELQVWLQGSQPAVRIS